MNRDTSEQAFTAERRIDALLESIRRMRIWALVLYLAFAGTMFGAMARGFGWI